MSPSLVDANAPPPDRTTHMALRTRRMGCRCRFFDHNGESELHNYWTRLLYQSLLPICTTQRKRLIRARTRGATQAPPWIIRSNIYNFELLPHMFTMRNVYPLATVRFNANPDGSTSAKGGPPNRNAIDTSACAGGMRSTCLYVFPILTIVPTCL